MKGMRSICLEWYGCFKFLLFLLPLVMCFLAPRICQAQIISFEYAYDRLLAGQFGNRPGPTQIFGNPIQLTGPVNIQTEGRKFSLGQGLDWLFYYADRSEAPLLYWMAFVSISGDVSRKVAKNLPENLIWLCAYRLLPAG